MYNIAEKEKEKLCVSNSSLEKTLEDCKMVKLSMGLLMTGCLSYIGGFSTVVAGACLENETVVGAGYGSMIASGFEFLGCLGALAAWKHEECECRY